MLRSGIATALLLLIAVGAEAQTPVTARPLSLEEALGMARPASELVGLARSAVNRARGEQLRARSELFPQLTGTASYSRDRKSVV